MLSVFFNHRLHEAGLVLVGSHAYGCLLNELGIRAPAYRTQDVDLARAQPLSLAMPEPASFAALLAESGLRFVPVPGMPSSRPSGSFKVPGADAMLVDLLVPGTPPGKVVEVRELSTHAQSIPLLDFLVEDAIESVALSPNHVVPLRVPAPERFLLHKLFASQSRRTSPGKAAKDLEQAAVLAVALEETMPGRIEDTWRGLPAAGRPAVRRGARAAARLLAAQHAEAQSALAALAGDSRAIAGSTAPRRRT